MDKVQKIEVAQDVVKTVFDPESVRLKKALDMIQDQHLLLHGSRAFLLDGNVVYNGDMGAGKMKGKVQIDERLREEARFLIKQQTKLRVDSQRIVNFFGVCEPHCQTEQDYRDVLPDMVVEHMNLDHIKRLPRTRKQGYIFSSPPWGSPTKEKMFVGALDIMFSYLVNRLVF